MPAVHGKRGIHATFEVYHSVYIRAPLLRDHLSRPGRLRSDSAQEESRGFSTLVRLAGFPASFAKIGPLMGKECTIGPKFGP